MADAEASSSLALENEVEHDIPEAELEHDVELDVQEGDEAGDMGTAGSNACEGLPGVAGDTPSGGQPVIAKLLISNAAAGSVIGKVSGDGQAGAVLLVSTVCHSSLHVAWLSCRVVRPSNRYKRTLVHVCSCPGLGSSTQVGLLLQWRLYFSCDGHPTTGNCGQECYLQGHPAAPGGCAAASMRA